MPAWICVNVRRPVRRHRPAAAALPDLLPTSGSTSAGTVSGGPRCRAGADHATVLREEEPGLIGIGVEPAFAIGQRALLVRTPHGNVLWDCIPLLDAAAPGAGRRPRRHPDHLHVTPALLRRPRRVRRRLRRPGPHPDTPTGDGSNGPRRASSYFDDEVEPVPGVTLARIGGHFDGAAVLHWPAGSEGRGALADRRHDHRCPGPRLGQLHVELPQPDSPGRGHRARHRAPRRAIPLRPDLRRLVGTRGHRRRSRRGTPLRRPLHRTDARRATTRSGRTSIAAGRRTGRTGFGRPAEEPEWLDP